VNTLWGHTYYIGLSAIILNIAVSAVLTLVLKAVRVPAGTDETLSHQYTADPVDTKSPAPASAVLGSEVTGGTYRDREP
jgi:SSS family solute:Na+ symporter